jgi:hypothetical protein
MKNTIEKSLFACLLLVLPLAIHAQVLPDSFFAFRDTVYLQNRSLPEATRLYTAAKQDIETRFTGVGLFNLYLMYEAACLKQRRNDEAQIWHQRAAALYPTNNFISMLV